MLRAPPFPPPSSIAALSRGKRHAPFHHSPFPPMAAGFSLVDYACIRTACRSPYHELREVCHGHINRGVPQQSLPE
ncbi:Uncharacterised protein [Edwardsiella tarda]|nr:Uncharacterised protein [Edwardsiella tarda]